jgi:hypothetical protein
MYFLFSIDFLLLALVFLARQGLLTYNLAFLLKRLATPVLYDSGPNFTLVIVINFEVEYLLNQRTSGNRGLLHSYFLL